MSTELVAKIDAFIEACSGPGITLYEGHPTVLLKGAKDELTALTAKVAEAEQRIAALMSERSSLIATKAEQLVALTKRATTAEASNSALTAKVALLTEALAGFDAEDVQNMRDLMLKAERFYFGKSPYGEDIWVASRGASKWVVWNGGAFVVALDGQWVHEPMPSSRTDEFIASTRRTFADAVRAARALSEPDKDAT